MTKHTARQFAEEAKEDLSNAVPPDQRRSLRDEIEAFLDKLNKPNKPTKD